MTSCWNTVISCQLIALFRLLPTWNPLCPYSCKTDSKTKSYTVTLLSPLYSIGFLLHLFFLIKVLFLWPKKQYLSMWLVPSLFLKQLFFFNYLLCWLCSGLLNLIKYDYISHFWNIIVAIPLYKSHFLTLDITCSFLYFKFQFPCCFQRGVFPYHPV